MNQVTLIGRLVANPEVKQLQSGTQTASFKLAVDREISREKKEAGETSADFIPVTVWGKTADFVINYLGKGRLVAVSGRLQIRDYTSKEGERRTFTEVVADKVKGLDKANTGDTPAPYQSQPVARQAQVRPAPMRMDDISDPFEESIPGNPFA